MKVYTVLAYMYRPKVVEKHTAGKAESLGKTLYMYMYLCYHRLTCHIHLNDQISSWDIKVHYKGLKNKRQSTVYTGFILTSSSPSFLQYEQDIDTCLHVA